MADRRAFSLAPHCCAAAAPPPQYRGTALSPNSACLCSLVRLRGEARDASCLCSNVILVRRGVGAVRRRHCDLVWRGAARSGVHRPPPHPVRNVKRSCICGGGAAAAKPLRFSWLTITEATVITSFSVPRPYNTRLDACSSHGILYFVYHCKGAAGGSVFTTNRLSDLVLAYTCLEGYYE